jgi:hypothetical protein
MSGNSTARVVQSDIIYNKGVIHVSLKVMSGELLELMKQLIDSVLLNTMSDPEAAAGAFESATAAAVTSTEPTAPVTNTSPPASASASGSGSAPANAGSRAEWNSAGLGLGSVIAAAGVILGGGAVLM